MGFLIGFLTFIMIVDCLVLILLVLIQLPKKEAGAGLAFGGSTSDALFGAGSGNVLTRITKYSAGIFFALALLLAVMQRVYHNRNQSTFERGLATTTQSMPPSIPATPGPESSGAPSNAASAAGGMLPMMSATNAASKPAAEQPAPSASSTNAAPK